MIEKTVTTTVFLHTRDAIKIARKAPPFDRICIAVNALRDVDEEDLRNIQFVFPHELGGAVREIHEFVARAASVRPLHEDAKKMA